MGRWSPHASGISIIMEWGRDLPVARSSSRALSKLAVSLCPGVMMGSSFFTSLPKIGEENIDSLAAIQLMLPRSVLISPLCMTKR